MDAAKLLSGGNGTQGGGVQSLVVVVSYDERRAEALHESYAERGQLLTCLKHFTNNIFWSPTYFFFIPPPPPASSAAFPSPHVRLAAGELRWKDSEEALALTAGGEL